VIDHLLAGDDAALGTDPLTTAHAEWAREVAAAHPELCEENAHEIIRGQVGQVFGRVLEDAGVFKWDEEGRAAQRRFVESL
jgi:UDPglucose--hexose-1-phosphate uridylyltransferase